MRILIVDDDPKASSRIRNNLEPIAGAQILVIESEKTAMELIRFGLQVDLALIDLYFRGDPDGVYVCQTISSMLGQSVIVGYSSGFDPREVEDPQSGSGVERFRETGADLVCPLEVLTTQPVSKLESLWAETARKKKGLLKAFIGSSSEALEIARGIELELEHDLEATPWNRIFDVSALTLDALEEAVNIYDIGIFVFGTEDHTVSRSEAAKTTRDNVLFEAGMFMGSLGRERTFVVKPRDPELHLPSDLSGLTIAEYDPAREVRHSLGPACEKIRRSISKLL